MNETEREEGREGGRKGALDAKTPMSMAALRRAEGAAGGREGEGKVPRRDGARLIAAKQREGPAF